MIFFLKIQLLVFSIGLYIIFKDDKKLIKMMTSGLIMDAFVFINLLLIFLLVTQIDVGNIKESVTTNTKSITSIVDTIFYTIFVIIVIEIIMEWFQI
jgi:hypothetical protein